MPRQGLFVLIALGTLGVLAQAANTVPSSRPDEPATSLYLAESSDGLQFTSSNEVAIATGIRPDLVALPDKQLLAVFETGPGLPPHSSDDSPSDTRAKINPGGTVDRDSPGLWATRSTDKGKTWLPTRPIRLTGLPEGTRIGSPDLVLMPSGLVRLYFEVSAEKADRPRSRGDTFIGSAVTRDGIEYQVDRQVRIPCPDLESPRLSAFWTEKQLVLLVTGRADARSSSKERGGMVQQFVSADGRSFAAPDRARFAGEIGHVVRLDQHHWRMFTSAGGEIRSRMSNDGIRWREESGTCMHGGADPAVAQVDKNSVMIFTSARRIVGTEKTTSNTGTNEPGATGGLPASALRGKEDSTKIPPATGEGFAKPQSSGEGGSADSDTTGWEAFAPGGYESELGADWTGRAAGQSQTASGSDFDLAPLPDFHTKVDYTAWFEQNCSLPDDQNAASSYSDAIATFKSYPAGTVLNMFNDEAYKGPPIPWNASTHPEWEKSYLATQDALSQFRAGSEDRRPYATPPTWSENSQPENRLLIELLLPNLAGYRNMTRATLGQAWREENGVVPPDQMRTALDTVLGNVAHLSNGSMTIEFLVGVAEQNLANENARWALARGVFPSAEEIETTLDLLRTKEPAQADPGRWVRSEHAASLDMLQYMFQEETPGGEPVFQIDRAERILGPMSEQDREVIPKMQFDARGSAEAVDGYYRRLLDYFENRYPYEGTDGFEDQVKQIKEEHPIAGPLLASLSRAGELTRRSEATRRATQLSYSVELFRAQSGRYPASLDELPSDQIADVRTDPYSRQDFAYRITPSGPMIYSVSTNGQDDGGAHSKRWGDEKKEGESDDYVFWPPQE